MYQESVLATIGQTPLIKLSRISGDFTEATVLGKIEAFNPGQSAKDRIALYMVDQAEREGRIRPGATIIEATSGNTGYSLAMVCALRGYRCVLTVTNKAGREKLALLRSLGAEVIVCPAEVEPDHPESYYSRAQQLADEIPNSVYLKQNWNPGNPDAHYYSTGPEIWEQTEGKITHYVCCAGTGGTLSGTARYLKERNPDIQIIAVDAYGSVLKKYWETGIFDKDEIYPYKIEGLGKTIIPDNVDFDLIDEFIKVHDKESAFITRELAMREGLLLGYSSGAVMQCIKQLAQAGMIGKDDVVVGLMPDHGSRYLGKVFSEEWMQQQGFSDIIGTRRPAPTYHYTYSYSYDRLKRVYRVYKRKYGRYLRQTLKI